MDTITTDEAVKLLRVSRPQFSRLIHKYGFEKVEVKTGRGNQTIWNAKRIREIANARSTLKHTS